MAYYKICRQCGMRYDFQHRARAPKKCKNPNCGGDLWNLPVMQDMESEDLDMLPEQAEAACFTNAEKEGLSEEESEEFFFWLVSEEEEGEIRIPHTGGIVGRAGLGRELLQDRMAVSRKHIEVTYWGNAGLVIKDVSKYGTLINNEKMIKGSSKIAVEGNVISLFDYKLKIVKRRG